MFATAQRTDPRPASVVVQTREDGEEWTTLGLPKYTINGRLLWAGNLYETGTRSARDCVLDVRFGTVCMRLVLTDVYFGAFWYCQIGTFCVCGTERGCAGTRRGRRPPDRLPRTLAGINLVLSCYEHAARCPVLTQQMVLPGPVWYAG